MEESRNQAKVLHANAGGIGLFLKNEPQGGNVGGHDPGARPLSRLKFGTLKSFKHHL